MSKKRVRVPAVPPRGGGPTHDPVRGFSLEYELVPGVPPAARDDFLRYLVPVAYDADVELPWDPTDGGAIAHFEGGDATHGSRGSWPLADGATTLTFVLSRTDTPFEDPAGELVVDLAIGTARWRPAG